MPFEMNTTFRCAIVSISQTIHVTSAMIINTTALIFVFGIVMYVEAILLDIKTLFNRIDRISKSNDNDAELSMFQYCREALDLHSEINRCSNTIIRLVRLGSNFSLFSSFWYLYQLLAAICRFDEHYHLDDSDVKRSGFGSFVIHGAHGEIDLIGMSLFNNRIYIYVICVFCLEFWNRFRLANANYKFCFRFDADFNILLLRAEVAFGNDELE